MQTIRPIALQRIHGLYDGHDAGAQNGVMLASLIETCNLNQIEPRADLTGDLTAIVSVPPQNIETSVNRYPSSLFSAASFQCPAGGGLEARDPYRSMAVTGCRQGHSLAMQRQ